jgi:general stress protein 26
MQIDQLLEVTRATLERVDYGFLVTSAPDGPDARLVKHLDVDDDFGVWFGTSARSRKARQVATGKAASFAVEDRPNFAYVTLKGRATVVVDLQHRRDHWQEGLAMFFPDGPESDEFTLIHLATHRIELMSFAAKIHPEPLGLVPAALDRTEDGWVLTEAERFS